MRQKSTSSSRGSGGIRQETDVCLGQQTFGQAVAHIGAERRLRQPTARGTEQGENISSLPQEEARKSKDLGNELDVK